ncbi:YihY/virulence factor BrkB family protein [Streptomyces sp. NPDC087270]|uniref:YihY/virulence factor BrkB family protein n=1 Tax=Streptomyces sp. NPDC087270 TaxID=3365774 RepID=UPI0037FE21A3
MTSSWGDRPGLDAEPAEVAQVAEAAEAADAAEVVHVAETAEPGRWAALWERATLSGRTGLDVRSRREALGRVLGELREDNLGDRAAAMTYYAVLSLVPALLVFIAVLGEIGPSATDLLIRDVHHLAPGPARDLLTHALTHLQRQHVAAGTVGLLTMLWSASGYTAAFIRAMNAVYDVPEGRPLTFLLPLRLGLTVLVLVLMAVFAALAVLSGRLAGRVGTDLGAGHTTTAVWQWGKWPLALALLSLLFALLYWAAPNARQRFRWGTLGGLVAVVVWVVASVGFELYAAHFASYDRVYGSLGAVITFLVWLWLSNLAILLGAEINAELDRQRAIADGHPAGQEPYMPLRSAHKLHSDAL